MLTVVLDTNIVLDVFVFHDAAALTLGHALASKQVNWLATAPMRDELARVLTYAHIVRRLADSPLGSMGPLTAQAVLASFDRHAVLHDNAPRAPAVCKDPDDQRFIDLAVAHRALLISKDRAVTSMKKRLAALGVEVWQCYRPEATSLDVPG